MRSVKHLLVFFFTLTVLSAINSSYYPSPPAAPSNPVDWLRQTLDALLLAPIRLLALRIPAPLGPLLAAALVAYLTYALVLLIVDLRNLLNPLSRA